MRIFIILVMLCSRLNAFGQSENPKLIITHLTKDFYIYTTFSDPGDGSLFPANGMYLITDKGAVLFDTPWDTAQFQPLLDSIKLKHNQNVLMCISTHFHSDRIAGLDYYKRMGIHTYTTKLTDEFSKQKGAPRATYLIENDTTFNIGQYSFETFYPGKGHSTDNIVIWVAKEKIIYGGCFIKSTDTKSLGNLSDANTDDWAESIKKVQDRFVNPDFIITGHQSWSSKKSLIHTLKLLNKYKKKNS